MKTTTLTFFLAIVFCQTLTAQTWYSQNTGLWSAASTWTVPSGAITTTPPPGSTVYIRSGNAVILDTDYLEANALAKLEIHGQLDFGLPTAGATRTLACDHIAVFGAFHVGVSPTARFLGKAEIILTGPSPASPYRELIVHGGGILKMHGAAIQNPWVQLKGSIASGVTIVTVEKNVADWPTGSEIVVASTDHDMNESETFNITTATANVITLPTATAHEHFGAESTAYNGRRVNMRGEVGLLSRNIIVRGPTGAGTAGGNIEIRKTRPGQSNAQPTVHLECVEFTNMGQRGVLGRYPVHFHHAGNVSGSYVKKCAVHRCHFRAIALHNTQGAVISDNVTYDILGHAYYLEDGREVENSILRNLGVLTRKTVSVMRDDPFTEGLVSSDDQNASTFWITHPHNEVHGNHAAGSEVAGFWFQFHDPSSLGGPGSSPTQPLDLAPVVFEGNTSHSNGLYGIFDDNFAWRGTGSLASANWANTTVYKNGQHGFWVRGFGALRTPGLRAADNPSAVYFASTAIFGNEQTTFILDDALIIGESSNTGDPTLGPIRTQPLNPFNADLIGVELYDGLMRLVDCDFAQFPSTSARRAGCIGANYTDKAATVDPRTTVSDIRFHPNSSALACNPIWFRSSSFGTFPSGNGSRGPIINALTTTSAWTAGETIVAANGVSNPNLAFLAYNRGAANNSNWNAHVIPPAAISPPLPGLPGFSTVGTHGRLFCGYFGTIPPNAITLADTTFPVSRQVGANGLTSQSALFPVNMQAGRTYDLIDGISSRSGVQDLTWGFGAPWSLTNIRIAAPASPLFVNIYFEQPSSESAGLGTRILYQSLSAATIPPITNPADLVAWQGNSSQFVAYDLSNGILYLKLFMADPIYFGSLPMTPNMPSYANEFSTEKNLHGFSMAANIIW